MTFIGMEVRYNAQNYNILSFINIFFIMTRGAGVAPVIFKMDVAFYFIKYLNIKITGFYCRILFIYFFMWNNNKFLRILLNTFHKLIMIFILKVNIHPKLNIY